MAYKEKLKSNTGLNAGVAEPNAVSAQGAAGTMAQAIYPTYLNDGATGTAAQNTTSAQAQAYGTTGAADAANGALAGLFSTGISGNIGSTSTGSTGTSGGNTGSSATNPNQQYIDQLNSLYSQIMNRGVFSYDLQGDPLYRQYADQYTQLGKQAMRDTQAQSAALTGGYGNSWASSAGSQAYQQYLNQLNSVIPDLYDRAYQAWQDEYDDLLTQYNLVASHPSTISAMTPQTTSSGSGRSSSKASTTDYSDLESLLDAIIAADDESDTETVETPGIKTANDFVKSTTGGTGSIGNTTYAQALEYLLKNKKTGG